MNNTTTPQNIDYQEKEKNPSKSSNLIKPQTPISERIGDSFSIFFSDINYWLIGFFTMIIQSIVTIIMGILIVQLGKNYFLWIIEQIISISNGNPVSIGFILNLILGILFIITIITIVYTYIYGVYSISIIHYLKAKQNNEEIDLSKALSYGFQKVGLMFSIIIYSIKYYVLPIILMIVGLALSRLILPILLFIYGFYLCVKVSIGLTFALYIGAREDVEGKTAIEKSFTLSEGNIGRILGNNLLMGLLIGTITGMVGGFVGVFIPQENYLQNKLFQYQTYRNNSTFDTIKSEEDMKEYLKDEYNRGNMNNTATISLENDSDIDDIKNIVNNINVADYFFESLSIVSIINIIVSAAINGFGAIMIVFLYLLYIAIKEEKVEKITKVEIDMDDPINS